MYALLKWGLLLWAASQLFRKEKGLPSDAPMASVPPGGALVPSQGTLDDVLMQSFAADWIAGAEDVGGDGKLFGALAQAAAKVKVPVRWLTAFVALAQKVGPPPDFHRRVDNKSFQSQIDAVANGMHKQAEETPLPSMADIDGLAAWRQQLVQGAVERWVKGQ